MAKVFSCLVCEKAFDTYSGLNGHQKVHASSYAEVKKEIGEKLRHAGKKRYEAKPKRCGGCGEEIAYEQNISNHNAKFCSNKCAASVNNVLRGKLSAKTKSLISLSLKARREKASQLLGKSEKITIKSYKFFLLNVDGPYSKVFKCECKHCNVVFVSSKKRKYCTAHRELYLDKGRNLFEFTLNPFDHPQVFSKNDLLLLAKNGFWSPKNKDGLTRDHRVSVNEAIKNGYDPYYIKHPINCEIMSWQKNNEKKAKSSIGYKELRLLVDEYEMKKSIAGWGSGRPPGS